MIKLNLKIPQEYYEKEELENKNKNDFVLNPIWIDILVPKEMLPFQWTNIISGIEFEIS